MAAPEIDWFGHAIRRVSAIMLVLSLAGTLGAFAWRGWQWGTGFALGAVISWLNFRWLKLLTDALGGGRRPLRGSAVVLAFRYLLLGGGAYVILRFTSISLPGVLTGLFVAAAAVVGEILLELIYGRT